MIPSFSRCCFRYHKGTDFQANHNSRASSDEQARVVLDTTKVQIFKQITTEVIAFLGGVKLFQIPQRYRFSSKSQLRADYDLIMGALFQIPQRYRFSSKSQRILGFFISITSCFRYHKGTDFQANHNVEYECFAPCYVVLDTTKVQIFKQITTKVLIFNSVPQLFQIPQRYRFSSKSQQNNQANRSKLCCFRYHKGTDFQANHNPLALFYFLQLLFQIPQRYRFSSKSQQDSL